MPKIIKKKKGRKLEDHLFTSILLHNIMRNNDTSVGCIFLIIWDSCGYTGYIIDII